MLYCRGYGAGCWRIPAIGVECERGGSARGGDVMVPVYAGLVVRARLEQPQMAAELWNKARLLSVSSFRLRSARIHSILTPFL